MFIPSDPAAQADVAMPDADGVRDALQSQLGLTVKEETAPVKVPVIDRLETVPIEN
jgi:uncharacterized protein (TIGR03435 family)